MQFTVYTDDYIEELPLHFALIYKDAYNQNYEADISVTIKLFTGLQARKYGLKEGNSGIVFVLGAVAGFIPAYRAATLKPVEAVRYE